MYILCMATKIKLTAEDRAFFQLVGAAAFSNPFSEQRDQLDRQLAGVTGSKHKNQLQAAIASVHERMQQIERGGRASLSLYQEEDRSCRRWGCCLLSTITICRNLMR